MSADDTKPTPYELVKLALALNGPAAILRGSDHTTEELLSNALHVWGLARGVLVRGGSELEIEEATLRADALQVDTANELLKQSPDEVVSFSDPRLLRLLGERENNPGVSDLALGERVYDRWRKRLDRAGRKGEVTPKSSGITLRRALDDFGKGAELLQPAVNRASRTASGRTGNTTGRIKKKPE